MDGFKVNIADMYCAHFKFQFIVRVHSQYHNLLYIAVVLCVVIGQLHADKFDNHAISR